PGETEEEFEDTISLVKEVEYDSAFMFIYSPRPGTGAPNLPDHVPEEVKRERIHRLIEVQNEISARKNAAMVGSVQEVLTMAAFLRALISFCTSIRRWMRSR